MLETLTGKETTQARKRVSQIIDEAGGKVNAPRNRSLLIRRFDELIERSQAGNLTQDEIDKTLIEFKLYANIRHGGVNKLVLEKATEFGIAVGLRTLKG